nr:hypothetical protein [Tanacetum cinerariifolium]
MMVEVMGSSGSGGEEAGNVRDSVAGCGGNWVNRNSNLNMGKKGKAGKLQSPDEIINQEISPDLKYG